MSTLATLNVVLNGDIRGFISSMKSAEDASRNSIERITTAIGSKMTAIGSELTRGLTLPLAGVGVAASKVAGDFEAQMNLLAVAARGGSASLEDLRNVALRAGLDVNLVGVSASDIAGSMTDFAKAGLSVNDTLGSMEGYLSGTAQMGGALRAAIDLSAASELDLAQATELVVTTMSTYGITADQASSAMNNYVQTADASVASVSDLAQAMANIGPTMATFGFGLGDTNAALAILSTRGIQGAEAGTALKSMFTNIMRPTDTVKATLNQLGVTLYDSTGKMRSMADIIGQFSVALNVGGKGARVLTEEERNLAVQILAGTYGMKSMNTLLEEGSAGFEKMKTSIAGAATMQEIAAARTQGFNAKMGQLKDSIESALITIGTPLIDAISPVLTDIMNVIQKVATAFESLPPDVKKGIVVVLGLVAALGPVLIIGGQIITAIGAIAGVLSGPLVLAIGAAVAAGIAIAQNWETIWPQIQGVVEGVVSAIRSIIESVLGAVNEFVARHGQEIQTWVAGAWERIQTIVQTVIAIIQATVVPALQGIADFIRQHSDSIVAALEWAWNTIRSVIDVALATIQGILNTVMAAINGDWDTVWNNIKTAAENIWNAIGVVWNTFMTQVLPAAWEAFKQVFQIAWDTFWGTTVPAAWESFRMLFQMAWDTFWGTTVPAAWTSFTQLFQILWDQFWGTTVPAAWESFRMLFQMAWDTFWGTTVPAAWESFKMLFQMAWDTFWGTTVPAAWESFKQLIAIAWNQLWTVTIPNVWNSFKAAFTGAWNGFWGGIKTTVENIWAGIQKIIRDATQGVQDLINSITGAKRAAESVPGAASNPSSPFAGGSAGGSASTGNRARALGGAVDEGWWYLHDNEYVLSAAMRAGREAIPGEAFDIGGRSRGEGQTRGSAPTADLVELVALLRSMPRDMARAVRDGLIQAQA